MFKQAHSKSKLPDRTKVNRLHANFALSHGGEIATCLNFKQHLLGYVREQYNVSDDVVVVRTAH